MIDYLTRLTCAQTIEDAWPIHCDAMASFGFNRLLYGMTRSRIPGNFGPKEDFLILTNLNEDYTYPFIEHGLYKQAPMMRWVLSNSGAQSWGYVTERLGTLTPEEKQVLDFNSEHGVLTGYSVSFREVTARSIAAIALISDANVSQEETDAVWAKHGAEIVAMNNVMQLKIMQLPYTSMHKRLTKRQRETLEWVGEGKTTQDIGVIMGLTAATVEKHLRLAREALDVETTAQAVVKASFQNQIFLLEDVGQ